MGCFTIFVTYLVIVFRRDVNILDKLLEDLKTKKECIWINDKLISVMPNSEMGGYKYLWIQAAQNRLIRFMPFIESAFPQTADRKGIIESRIIDVSDCFDDIFDCEGRIIIKDDAHLPIAGSVKARGGIHEVLAHAERLLQKEHLLMPGDDYSEIDSDEYRDFFGKYTIQVGSTGNLGLSIGIMSSKLGFKVIVHMSSDAKEWKKDLLRSHGVTVKEYKADYSVAVKEGREASNKDPNSYFVDDENSKDLFFGYSTAALRLKVQFLKENIAVDKAHPLFVYLPCGVGGAPGGITYGLKQVYGDNVHCFFAEPVGAPCFTLGMATGKKGSIAISDIGLDGNTQADGLAVGRPSQLVCEAMDTLVSGSFTVSDQKMIEYMKLVYNKTGIFFEPSACAGFVGMDKIQKDEEFVNYLKKNELIDKMQNATHLVWTTGGGMVPEKMIQEYLAL